MSTSPPYVGCVALTGATGFVGGHILRQLVTEGWRVKALTRRKEALADSDEAVTPVVGALESPAALADLVEGVEAVVHCAGLVAARRRDEFHAANAVGTENLLRAASADSGKPRFILISSLAAREPGLSPYAASKREAEDVLRRDAGEIAWQILRPPVVYGPGDRATLDLFRQFHRGLALLPRSGGRFSMIYATDLAGAVAALLRADDLPPQIMELDDGKPDGYSWDEFLTIAEAQLGHKVRRIAVPQPLQRVVAAASVAVATVTGGIPFLSQGKVNEISHPDWVSRSNLLSEAVPWKPLVSFDQGFPMTLAWYKAAGWL